MKKIAYERTICYRKNSMATPRPGRPVRGSKTGRPVMALLDLLGRRTALRILWELRSQPLTFRALQEAAETNPGVLNSRLTELREARIVEGGSNGYTLTRDGQMLLETLAALSSWADAWAARLQDAPR